MGILNLMEFLGYGFFFGAIGVSALGIGAIRCAIREKKGHGSCYGKRGVDLPEWMPQVEFDLCAEGLVSSNITVEGWEEKLAVRKGFQAKGVPPACMDLAVVLKGKDVDRKEMGTHPTACGEDCLLYENLMEEEVAMFQNIVVELSV